MLFLHMGEFLYALSRVVTVRPAAAQFRWCRFNDIDQHGKLFSPPGQIAVLILMISPEV